MVAASGATAEVRRHPVPLSGRLRAIVVGRVALAIVVFAGFAPVVGLSTTSGRVLGQASAGVLALNAAVLAGRRRFPGAGRLPLDLSLLGDAAWASAVMWLTGYTASSLIVLMYVQLLAVTVLFGWRTGLKLALLHTVGLLANAYGQSQLLEPGGADTVVRLTVFELDVGLSGTLPVLRVQTAVAIASVWLMTGVTAVFTAVNDRDLRRSNQELTVLLELNTQLERSLDLSDVCEAIAVGVVDDLGYRRSVVWMAQGGNDLVPAGAEGFDTEDLEVLSGLRLAVGPGPVGRAIESREPTLVPRDEARPAALADAFAIDSPLVLVPLTSERRVLGLLVVEVAAPLGRAPRVAGRDLRILATLATEASLALDNARLHAELRDLSVTDALTGVYNHRYFQQRLQEELDRAVRRSVEGSPQPVSLILMDLDLFKRVNDRFGHQAGDELLSSLARLMQRVLRSSDVVCRYGGEEFTIILPETALARAVPVAERLREATERSNFTASDGRFLGQVTASFGVSGFESRVPSRSELIREADEALYRAKNAGRNVVAVGEEVLLPAHGSGRRAPPDTETPSSVTAGEP